MTRSGIAAEHIVARDGRTIAVHVSGPRDSMPVVLLHGQIHTAACWSRIMAGQLAQDHRLIAPDLAGHGGSDPPDFANGDWMAEDLADVLAALGAEDPVLVGWSFGSVVAAAYAASGRSVRGLVLVGAGTRASGAHGLGLDQVRLLLGAADDAAPRPYALQLFRDMLSDDPVTADGGVACMIDACRANPLDADIRTAQIEHARRIPLSVRAAIVTMPYDNAEFFAACDLPILQIHGARDAIRPVAAAHERAPWFRRGKTEIWADAGHAPFDDEPDRFATRIATFCRETRT